MSDKKISELVNITGSNIADTDEFVVVDASASETKAITAAELRTAIGNGNFTVTGNLTVQGTTITVDSATAQNIVLGDNDKMTFGAGSDLQIFHTGTYSNIRDAGTGALYIGGDDEVSILNASLTEYKIKAETNGAVTLYYDNAPKLATSNTGATITGKTTTDELDLNAIAATISDTAVDIFVYDTRKDSDGGAWRKRTQHTSWYNETLNTATRGSRKEFPAVAVIVAETNQVTIYDGDDPDLPMWMVFNAGSSYAIKQSPISTISIINGLLSVGASAAYGINRVDFIQDKSNQIFSSDRQRDFLGSIADRNAAKDYESVRSAGGGLINDTVNDVAMTVLPNAPIDAATGLPVPTIAVATNGGVSVIKDDGTVVDIVHSDTAVTPNVWLDGDTIAYNASNFLHACKIPSADVSAGLRYAVHSDDIWFAPRFYYPSVYSLGNFDLHPTGGAVDDVIQKDNFVAVRGSDRLTLASLSGNQERVANDASYAWITSSYNTGWMNGDIKLATLSDTDATNVTGSELVTNGTFDTDISGWTDDSDGGGSISWNSSGYLNVTNTSGTARALQTVTTEVGKKYTYTVNVISEVGNGYIYAGVSGNSGGLVQHQITSTGIKSFTFTATSTSTELRISNFAAGTTTVDNISVRLAEEDRSVNGNGLQVFGTVTKSAVATGADLVGYSGFSGSNYLIQPVNSDLTGSYDSCFMGWVKTSSTSQYQYIFALGTSSTDVFGLAVHATTGYLYAFDDINSLDASSTNVADGSWHHVCLVHRNGVNKQLYVDGSLVNTSTTSSYTHSSNSMYKIGNYYTANYPFLGSLALQRFSKTIPSPEQIKKIYEDEKVLFQEGAQATLYGSSDAVTALAYDDSTNLLHVGTSAGRSVFQGLRRVNNTTTAVTSAISASNGLIVEQ